MICQQIFYIIRWFFGTRSTLQSTFFFKKNVIVEILTSAHHMCVSLSKCVQQFGLFLFSLFNSIGDSPYIVISSHWSSRRNFSLSLNLDTSILCLLSSIKCYDLFVIRVIWILVCHLFFFYFIFILSLIPIPCSVCNFFSLYQTQTTSDLIFCSFRKQFDESLNPNILDKHFLSSDPCFLTFCLSLLLE